MQHKPLLFMGSSHTAYGICDEMPEVHNVGAYNEPFLFSLKKIQLLKPRKIVLSVNLQNVQYNYDEIFKRGILSMAQFDYLMHTLNEEEWRDVDARMDFETRALYECRKLFPLLGQKWKWEDTTLVFGRWIDAGDRSELSKALMQKRLKEEFLHTGFNESEFQWKYLQRIIEYCRQEGITVILLSTPLQHDFYQQIPAVERARFKARLQPLLSDTTIVHWEYSACPFPSSYFLDSDHLNGPGARAFTQRLFEEHGTELR